jgi:hypothetical protein
MQRDVTRNLPRYVRYFARSMEWANEIYGQRSEIKTEAEDCIETWQVKHMGRSQANLV